ncbi:PREDICTED: uncharacterized protein LOC108613759 [Drosophila arizonae]|uniref:Uncharacterized protein LOC108613759 n=1 Tax=Drosophila arizonae TaxID=7263 RepID=A0ABM1P704_DROAR|nr:PREDICTED: uncharacterized protein LOC108613759 [Drosophila arizonae]
MERLLVLLGICALVHTQYLNNSSEQENDSKLFFERIRVHADQHFMKAFTHIHEDRKHFDVFVQLDRKLGSNYLIMNIKTRVKREGSNDFIKTFDLRHMDFCSFLNNPDLRHFFMTTIHFNKALECPVQVGNYSVKNIGVLNIINEHSMRKGTYKFFAEIAEVTSDIPKIFALQVITIVM